MRRIVSVILIGGLTLSLFIISASAARAQSATLTFAAFGDYGVNDEYEAAVASIVTGWNPDLILALGDAYYADAGGTDSEKYDLSTGKYYCDFLTDVTTTGSFCPVGQAAINKFFPALGDHDYDDAGMTNNLPTTYTDYFHLPGNGYTSSSDNERYYDFVSGPVHFFILNSLDQPGWEPDGTSSTSVQAEWLRTQMGASTSTWNIVVTHNPPYSSGTQHGSSLHMQWPFAQWGADAVLSGDDHIYERIHQDGIVYFVNGLGGAWTYPIGTPVEGSAFRLTGTHGAQRIVASDTSLTFEFYSVENGGTLQDTYTVTTPHNTATPTLPISSTDWYGPSKQAAATGTGDGNGYEVNPTAAYADDDLFAMDLDSGTSTVTDCNNSGKDRHRFLNYTIAVPDGATIQGIQIRLDAKADSTVGAPKICAAISWNNADTWSEWKSSPTLTTDETTYILGSSSDTWGHAWIPTELYNANFQVRIADVASDNSRDFSLDWIAVRVAYSLVTSPTATLTGTSVSPTATHTATSTQNPASATPTFSPTSTLTNLPVSPTSTYTPTVTATFTPTVTATDTTTSTPTQTSLPSTATYTPTHTVTFTPTAETTDTATFTSTTTSIPSTATFTPTYTVTFTQTNTVTYTPTATATSTRTPTVMASNTTTPSSGLPGKAALVAPSGTISSNQPAYVWNVDSGATWYYLWINDSSGKIFAKWYESAKVCSNGTCSLTPNLPLKAGTYTWWVRTYNEVGYGPWSAGMSFNVLAAPPPGAATLVSPSRATGDKTPTYTWNKVSGATWYYLWVDGPSGNVIKQWYDAAIVCGASTCSATPTSSLKAGDYIFYVRTWNPGGYGPWSSGMSFSLAEPGAATLLSPNGTIGTNQPTYTWDEVSTATWYYLYVNGPSGNVIKQWYTSAQANCNGTTCSVTPTTTLASGAYSWWVRTYNDVGYGPWSSRVDFAVSP